MKKIFFILLITALKINAQVNLNFNKKFVQCEDKWVAFKMNEDSTYTYGFIYIDEQAGLTFNNEGNFKFKPDGTIEIKKITDTNIKMRLQPNNVQVAIIPQTMFKDLQIDATPSWLKNYKTDTTSVKHLYKWGYMYNGWNECAKALTYLKKAQSIDPIYEGLAVELAFSYNCLDDYGNAVQILADAIQVYPTDAYINKEFIYTLVHMGQIDRASSQFHSSLKTLTDKQYNAENCYNIMQYYFKQNDKSKFNDWYKQLKKFPTDNKTMLYYADKMKDELNK